MDISLRALRYFVVAAETGSISAAAQRLNISQPSVSAAIQKIEEMLDTQLFFRVPTRGVRLTIDGETVLRDARSLLNHAEDFRDRASMMSNELAGEISLACFVNLGPALMGDLIRGFRARHPSIKINYRDANQFEILDDLRAGKIELAMTFDLEIDPALEVIEIAEMPPLAVLPVNDPLAKASSLSLQTLSRRPFILMDLPHTRDYFLQHFKDLGIEPDIGYRCGSFEAVRSFVASGLGVSLLNIRPAISETHTGRSVVLKPLTDPLRPLTVVLLRNPRLRLRRVVSVLSEFITEQVLLAQKKV